MEISVSGEPSSFESAVDSAEYIAEALSRLDEAMKQLPEEDSEAYYQAVSISPDVVEKESDPVGFLRVEGFSIAKAANRLAMYWKERKTAFGIRAFRPMTLCGEGALDSSDIKLLESGFVLELGCDQQGRPVMCGSPDRVSEKWAEIRLPRIRARFFAFTRIAMSHPGVCQTEGIVILHIVKHLNVDASMVVHMSRFVERCLPIKIHEAHICCIPPSIESKNHFTKTVLPVFLQGLGKEHGRITFLHIEVEPEMIAAKLSHHRLSRDILPTTIGGKWSFATMHDWMKQQRPGADGGDRKRVTDLDAQVPAPTRRRIGDKPTETNQEDIASLVERAELETKHLVRQVAQKLAAATGSPLATASIASVSGKAPVRLRKIHPKVEFALGALVLLEEEKKCSLRELLQDAEVEDILVGLGAPLAGGDDRCNLSLSMSHSQASPEATSVESEVDDPAVPVAGADHMVDVIADRLADTLSQQSGDARIDELTRLLQRAEEEGREPDEACRELVNSLLDSTMPQEQLTTRYN